jgi:plastocyanin
MIKHARVLLPALAALVLVAVPVAQAKPVRVAATVAVTAGKPAEFGFKLSTKTVAHGAVTFTVTNAGAIPHTFKVCSKPTKTAANTCTGKTTPQIAPGGKATLKYTFPAAGTYEYVCTLPGHAAGGMKGLLKVT